MRRKSDDGNLWLFCVVAAALVWGGCAEEEVVVEPVPEWISATISDAQMEAAEEAGLEPGIEIDLGDSVMMRLVYIPAGTFRMGAGETEADPPRDERPQHEVAVTKAFYLAATEVTQAQWRALMGTEPWADQPSVKPDPEHAANYLSWVDAQAFIQKLNATVPGGGFRLPTEAEWEYACRAGADTRFAYGDDPDFAALGRHAWFARNTWDAGEKYPHAVAQKVPNLWGLYAMYGNVWEWCADWYDGAYYGQSPREDPPGPVVGTARVLRGGSWLDKPRGISSSVRHSGASTLRLLNAGFRCARTPVPKGKHSAVSRQRAAGTGQESGVSSQR